MDPNATLKRIRELSDWFIDSHHTDVDVFVANALELAELNRALDAWLSGRGGFLPDKWQR